MKIAEVKIDRGLEEGIIYWKSGSRYRRVGEEVSMCYYALDRFLNQFVGIKDLEVVWVTVHDRPSKNRVECVVVEEHGWGDRRCFVRIPLLDNEEVDCGEKMDRKLSRFVGKKLYLQVEYE